MNENHTNVDQRKRSDAEWVADLSGANGPTQQEEAIENLSRYLYVVTYNNLWNRRRTVVRLGHFGDEDLCDLAMDFTQQFMEKMVQNQFALLKKYRAEGRFTTWAAAVTVNLVRSEFRKACWSRVEPLQDRYVHGTRVVQPELAFVNSQLHEILQAGIDKLPNRMRTVFIRNVIDGESTGTIAAEMGVTTNTIYLLIHRARKKLQEFLFDAGFEQRDVLVLGR